MQRTILQKLFTMQIKSKALLSHVLKSYKHTHTHTHTHFFQLLAMFINISLVTDTTSFFPYIIYTQNIYLYYICLYFYINEKVSDKNKNIIMNYKWHLVCYLTMICKVLCAYSWWQKTCRPGELRKVRDIFPIFLLHSRPYVYTIHFYLRQTVTLNLPFLFLIGLKNSWSLFN